MLAARDILSPASVDPWQSPEISSSTGVAQQP
jgi:hypothetical protein